jgi:2-polyprenyl-3-methyl-5-hydroxy-6-metoxy-1,4-benzoquinol methylase
MSTEEDLVRAMQAGFEFTERECCPACGSKATIQIVSLPFDSPPIGTFLSTHYHGLADLSRLTSANFDVHRCTACGLVFQKHVPTGRLLQDIYDVWIPPSEEARLRAGYTLSHYRYLAGQVDFLIQYFGVRPCEVKVFDFGMGWAEWINVARGYGCQVSGTELSMERIEHAREMGVRIVEWDQIPGADFHFINTEQVFEHLLEPQETIRHLADGLRPGGLLKISVPNGYGAASRLRKLSGLATVDREFIMPVQPLEHINCFDYSSLAALGKTVGLSVVRPQLRMLYNGSTGWFEVRQGLKNLLRPLYRHVFPKSTFVYFAKPLG